MTKELTQEQVSLLKNYGALGYPSYKVASLMGLEVKDVDRLLKDSTTEFSKAYMKGADEADYLIDLKLFDMARAGDIKAIEKMEYRKKMMERVKR